MKVDATQTGLYKMWIPAFDTGTGSVAGVYNRIVVNGDPYALASSVAWLHAFGKSDNAMAMSDMANKAMISKLHMACGPTAQFLKYLADGQGIPCRIIHIVTAGTPNGYNDGHEIVEMKVGGVWKAFDASLGFVPRDLSGNQLNIWQMVEGLQTSSVDLDRMWAFNYASDPNPPAGGEFDPAAWIEQGQLYIWDNLVVGINRLYQIPFIEASDGIWGYLPTGTESRAAYIASLGYHIMSKTDWLARFYP